MKKKRYPKQPKKSSSLDTWRNYQAKCREVDKFNREQERKENEKKRIIAGVQKMKR